MEIIVIGKIKRNKNSL